MSSSLQINKTMHKLIPTCIIVVITICCSDLFAQQQPGLSLYDQLAGIYNPSSIPDEYTYDQHNVIIGAMYRRQWVDLKSGPRTQAVSAEFITDYNNTFNLLMGAYILKDEAGPISTTGACLRLASIMSDYDPFWGGFSAGLQFGVTQFKVNTTALQEKYPNDILTYQNPQTIKPELSAGVSYYKVFDRGSLRNSSLNAGISVAYLAFNELQFEDELGSFRIDATPHFYVYGKFAKEFRDDRRLEFNTWAKYVTNAPANVDLHVLYYINDIIWMEAGYNSAQIAHVGFGLQFRDLFSGSDNLVALAYSLDPPIFKVANFFGVTHELSLRYSLAPN